MAREGKGRRPFPLKNRSAGESPRTFAGVKVERETGLEPAATTLATLHSTN